MDVPIQAKVNRKSDDFRNQTGLPFTIPDIMHKYQMVCLRAT